MSEDARPAPEPGTGPLVAVEGADGTGKSTLVAALATTLRAEGVDTVVFDFPDFAEPLYGPLIARYLRGELPASAQATPWFVASLFAGNRAALRDELRAAQATGAVVLCDRYTYSNVAYQGAKLPPGEPLAPFLDWVEQVEFTVLGCPRPTASLWLDMPVGRRPAAGTERGDRSYLAGRADIHEADAGLQAAVTDAYGAIARLRPAALLPVPAFDGAGALLPPAAVASAALAVLRRRGLLAG